MMVLTKETVLLFQAAPYVWQHGLPSQLGTQETGARWGLEPQTAAWLAASLSGWHNTTQHVRSTLGLSWGMSGAGMEGPISDRVVNPAAPRPRPAT
jgi:hypothetical protein